MNSTDLLTVRNLKSGYSGSTVLNGIDLQVRTGEAVGLLGRNGVGKTTLISTIMGFIPPQEGSIALQGQEIGGLTPERISRAGVALVPQGRRIFSDLTVQECLSISVRRSSNHSAGECWTLERVFDLFPRLFERLKNRGDQLSGGEQQMLAIGRALLGNPRLILMDEPSDGLAPKIIARIGDAIATLTESGMSVLLVEQDLRTVFRIAERVAIMDKGLIRLDTTTADFRSDANRARELLGIGA